MVGLATLLTPFCKAAAAGDEIVYVGSGRRLGERSLWQGEREDQEVSGSSPFENLKFPMGRVSTTW